MAEPARGTIIGRYVVVSRLGAGGMGVVFAAYDPELDRRVALKLLGSRRDHGGARARLQREAQALARLNHRNVVAVHDVGVHEGRVFVAMEFVNGETLAHWLAATNEGAPRSWKEVVPLFEAAGRGLAAAHEAGLVHRDVKPDNIMLNRDGRVLVMDFGLARSEGEHDSDMSSDASSSSSGERDRLGTPLTRTGALMGTPAYMAPEQFDGRDVTARSDQFSYCVALYEALYGKRPFPGDTPAQLAFSVTEGSLLRPPRTKRVPSWVRRIVVRGLSRDPQDRFESMADLLRAFEAGRARHRRSRWVMAAAVAAAATSGVFGLRHHDLARRVERCALEGSTIDEIWNDGTRDGVRAGLVATGAAHAPTVADKVTPWIDAYATSWREHTTMACMNHRVHRSWNAATLDKAQWCLEEGSIALATLLERLAGADERVVNDAVPRAAALVPLETCVNERSLAAMLDPPEPRIRRQVHDVRQLLAQASYMVDTGNYGEALDVAADARKRAEVLQWLPLNAAARAAEANALGFVGRFEEAEAVGIAAFAEAAESGAWNVAASAAVDLVDLVGVRRARHAEAETWATLASVAIAHATDPLGLREAIRTNHLGSVYQSKGEYQQARVLQEESLALLESALGPRHPQVAAVLNNLANTLDDQREYAEARAHHLRALAIRREAFGDNHPLVASGLGNLGAVHASIGEYDEAIALYEEAISIREKTVGKEDPALGMFLTNLGLLRHRTGDDEEARRLLQAALHVHEQTSGPDHPNTATVLEGLGALEYGSGRLTESIASHERVLDIRTTHFGPEHALVGASCHNLGVSHTALGNLDEAIAFLDRAVAIRERVGGSGHPKSVLSLICRGRALLDAGEHQRAIADLERAISTFPRDDLDSQLLPRAQFDLARALWVGPPGVRDRERALSLATRARDGYEGLSPERTEIDRWLTSRAPSAR